MKRRWLLLFDVLVVAVLAAGWLLVPLAEPRIGRKNFEKIQLGWTVQQTEDLLGDRGLSGLPEYTEIDFLWLDDQLTGIYVKFDRRHCVTEKHFVPSALSLFERLKRRIQLRAHVTGVRGGIQAIWP
jgi:hypothetical protein